MDASYHQLWTSLARLDPKFMQLGQDEKWSPAPFRSQGEIWLSHTVLSLLKKILHSLQQFSLYLQVSAPTPIKLFHL